MPRPIIPTTLARLPGMTDLAAGLCTSHDYYIKELDALSKWRAADIGTCRVFCPLNSFNIPSDTAVPGSVLALQGAGDILMLSPFLHNLPSPSSLTTYSKFIGIVDDVAGLSIHGIDLSGPADLEVARLRQYHEYTIHSPLGVKQMLNDAIAAGWDHYDWMGLMLGVKLTQKTAYLYYSSEDLQPGRELADRYPGIPLVAVHLTASDQKRSCLWLLPLLVSRFPNVKFILLGGAEIGQQRHTYVPGEVINMAGKLTYRETSALMRFVSAVIAVDSVVLHLSCILPGPGTRPYVLGLYGSTPTTWCGPSGPVANDYYTPMWANGMSNISPEEVYRWLEDRLRLT